MQLRIDEPSWFPFLDRLLDRDDVETAGFVFAERMTTSTGIVLRAKEFFLAPEGAYQLRRRDQLRLDPMALNRLVRPARDRGWSVFTIHTHPNASRPWFSSADDAGDRRLMPSFDVQMDGPHGSLVAVRGERPETSVMGRWWNGGGFAPLELRLVGRRLRLPDAAGAGHEVAFARQQLALGDAGQARLRRLRVGVVGLGGTGSVTAVHLAHLGVAEIVAMDGDLVESTNLSRVVGAWQKDVGRTPKVEVLRRYVEAAGLPTNVVAIRSLVAGEPEVQALRSCDVIFSCVDRHTPRALLNQLAYEALVPLIDMGTAFRVDPTGRMSASAGRVVVIGPGRPCLGCWGHIDPDALRVEALPPDDREELEELGYVEGAAVPQPSVIAFNTMVAAAAVIELLRLVCDFDTGTENVERLGFSFMEGVVRRNSLPTASACRICGRSSG
ncbi:MAG: ThiF family adenylyltransferase [Planctomycetes bacterium]|nr:ThiF family adenylyltransferase [Planctomycetota bacterium]